MKRGLILLAIIQTGLLVNAQQQQVPVNGELLKETGVKAEDTSSLLHAFKRGQVHGNFRYYFMATENDVGLSDYYANAVGGGIKFETAPFKGFQLGIAGLFVYNVGSSDLSKPDPKTNQLNRYEIGLFDIEDPSNKTDINKLGELYLKYTWKQSHLTFGKQVINTPFINRQDGRMGPTEVGGFTGEINDIKDTRIEVGYLYEISPRSTVKWFNVNESIGLYPQGVNGEGITSNYAGNLESRGIGLLGITYQFNENLSLKANDLFTENIFNSLLLQAEYCYPLKNKNKFVGGLQYIRQDAVNSGGNDDPAKTYFPKGGKSQTFGATWGWENFRWEASINYNRITSDGRYLMPREWGRDPFFTFLPRERNEGLADVNAYLLKVGYTVQKLRLKTQAGLGYFDLPEVTDYTHNKYGMPSYTHVNIEIQHRFEGFMKGLEIHVLFAHKGKTGNSYADDKYVINKVDMYSWNFVLNYRF